MILRAIDLAAFGLFNRRRFEFRRGLNLVLGPNESGKSTLMEAVPAVLFGVLDKKRFAPWGRGSVCRASLHFETVQGAVVVDRDLLTDEVSLRTTDDLYQVGSQLEGKASPRGRSQEREVYLDRLEELIGFRDAGLFRASLFFGQGGLEPRFDVGLVERIKTVLSGGGDSHYDSVLADLGEALFEVTRDNPWGRDKSRPRKLENARQELDRLREEFHRHEEAWQEYGRLEGRLRQIEAERQTVAARLEQLEASLERRQRMRPLQKDRNLLAEQLADAGHQLEKVRHYRAKVTAFLEELADLFQAPGRPVVGESFRTAHLLGQALSWSRNTDGIAQDGAEDSWRRLRLLAGACMVAAGGAGLVLWLLRPGFLPWLPGVAVVLGLTGLVLILAAGLTDRRAPGRRPAEEAPFDALGDIFAVPGGQVRARLLLNRERIADLIAGMLECQGALEALADQEELSEKVRRLTTELAILDERIQGLASEVGGEDVSVSEAELSAAVLREKQYLEKLMAERSGLLERRAEIAHLAEDRTAMTDRLAELEGQVSDLERRKRVLTLAVGELRGAVREFQQSYLQRFAERTCRHFRSLTGGRYRQIRIQSDFQVEILAGKAWRPSARFSQGTKDALALALRLGLVEVLSRGRKLPLLIDDALVNIDQSRQLQALSLLKKVAGDHQVVLFSHDERLGRRAAREGWNVITLDERADVRPEPRQEEEHAGQLHLL